MTVVLTLLVLAALGVPLMIILGGVTAALWLGTPDVTSFEGLTRLVMPMEALITKEEFLAIPLFMASGAIMTKGGLARRLVDIMRAAVGWMPGGLGVASIAACMFFASISGSSPVTLIAVGSIMVPAMITHNYPEKFALGIVMTAGSLGCIVPPALSMLIYAISVSGIEGNVDPSELFLAGLGPAVFIAGILSLYAWWVGRKIPDERPKFSWRELGQACWRGIWALMLPVLILGGIYGGMFTPSRAGAVAVVYSLLVTMLIYRELVWKEVVLALAEAGKLMGMLILIIGLAFGLNEYLADIQIDEVLKGLVIDWDLGPVAFMLLVNVILIVLGALMDSISATLIFAPMLAPIAVGHYGMDPLHFGIVFVVNMEIGYLMPPVATNLFVAAATFKKPFELVSKAVMPTLGLTIASLLLFMYVPSCSKGLVNLKEGVAIWEPFPWDGKPDAAAIGVQHDLGAAAPGTPEGDSLGAISARNAERMRQREAAEAEARAKAAAAAASPDAGATDPASEYKKYDDDPLGIGGGGEPAPAPSGDGPDAGASSDAEAAPETTNELEQYKKYDDDPLGIGGE